MSVYINVTVSSQLDGTSLTTTATAELRDGVSAAVSAATWRSNPEAGRVYVLTTTDGELDWECTFVDDGISTGTVDKPYTFHVQSGGMAAKK